jgi:hypothetical protein
MINAEQTALLAFDSYFLQAGYGGDASSWSSVM